VKHLDLFSGIGGFALAARWAGFETVAFCEKNDYCRDVLRKHWDNVPMYEDIRRVTGDRLKRNGIEADIITGGFPCQPFSVAGKRGGKGDDRYLWPEMLRIIQEMEPAWVIGENVRGIVNMELDQVLADLEDNGYSTESFVIPACAVNAPHRRDRVWIVANSRRSLRQRAEFGTANENETVGGVANKSKRSNSPSASDVADTNGEPARVEEHRSRRQKREFTGTPQSEILRQTDGTISSKGAGTSRENAPDTEHRQPAKNWWATEPNVGRVAHGIPGRVDRLKGLGNAVVPQIPFYFFEIIKKIESNKKLRPFTLEMQVND